MTSRTILIIVGIIVALAVVAGVLWRMDGGGVAEVAEFMASNQATSQNGAYTGPDLRLPFAIADINPSRGGINPLGVVRFSQDRPEFGHSGIDVPLFQNSPIYAVADGEIVIIKSASDPWGGQGIFQLLETTQPGEGWAYIYEHVTPAAGLTVGSRVKTGEVIATKTPPEGFTAHFQMSYVFNNHEFTRGMECWVDYLDTASSASLLNWWNARIASGTVAANWTGNIEEGAAPFEGLLDTTKFPEGPQLCYPPGTDVR